jgi:bacillithiol biosynthesis deacetylase BshB1
MKLDILVFAAHPDDAELACSGTIALHVAQGLKVGIVDLTQGELGTRGTIETRYAEAQTSSQILSISVRENLKLADGFFEMDEPTLLKLVEAIRKYQPRIILANAIHDRHPDHGRAAALVSRAHFLSGLTKVKTTSPAYRAEHVYHYIQDQYIQPDFVVDISAYWETKLNAIRAFKTQFFDPHSPEPATYISSPLFLEAIEARAKEFGHAAGYHYAEGFTKEKTLGVTNLFNLYV